MTRDYCPLGVTTINLKQLSEAHKCDICTVTPFTSSNVTDAFSNFLESAHQIHKYMTSRVTLKQEMNPEKILVLNVDLSLRLNVTCSHSDNLIHFSTSVKREKSINY